MPPKNVRTCVWNPSISMSCACSAESLLWGGICDVTRTAKPVAAAVKKTIRAIFSQKWGTGALASTKVGWKPRIKTGQMAYVIKCFSKSKRTSSRRRYVVDSRRSALQLYEDLMTWTQATDNQTQCLHHVSRWFKQFNPNISCHMHFMPFHATLCFVFSVFLKQQCKWASSRYKPNRLHRHTKSGCRCCLSSWESPAFGWQLPNISQKATLGERQWAPECPDSAGWRESKHMHLNGKTIKKTTPRKLEQIWPNPPFSWRYLVPTRQQQKKI